MCSSKEVIDSGNAVLGIEFGSTRIKAVLIDENNLPIAQGSFQWENKFENNVWTYSLFDVISGLQEAYRDLCNDVFHKYNTVIHSLSAMGVSAMMHGYLVFDKNDEQLVPFRTWRNTITSQASEELTQKFSYNIPQRWSVSHLYQAILNGEKTVADISFMTTLAGYVHWFLTDEKVLGIGDASGMFPIDSEENCYNENYMDIFDKLVAEKGCILSIKSILPQIKAAGENAGYLTEKGAKLIDPTGNLVAGIPMAAPEGDAGTGMVATNSTLSRTGNVSAGTSVFAMIVLDKPLQNLHTEIDMVTTPAGKPVAMVHCNNCTSDLNAWINIFRESSALLGGTTDMDEIYEKLYKTALNGESDCGGIISYNCFSGEPVIGLDDGRPMVIRKHNSNFSLSNFMRANLFASMTALKVGMDILTKDEGVTVDKLTGHGGLFKTKGTAQNIMASALRTPVSVMSTAGEGGAWGMALLASYMNKSHTLSLEKFLSNNVFNNSECETCFPVDSDSVGFEKYTNEIMNGIEVEKCASCKF